ncbi:MAG: tyrosine-type recombinase/integrase [Acidimicrobiales bacterium]
MRGTIRERSKGVWEVRAFAGRDPVTNRPRQVSRVVRGGKREAEKGLAELIHEVSGGEHSGTKTTLGFLLDSWMEQQERLGRSPVTLRNLTSVVESVLRPDLGNVVLKKLGPYELDAFYARQAKAGKAPATIRRYHSHLSAALNQAVRWGWIPSNPAKAASPPSGRGPAVVAPDVEKVRLLLEEADRRNPALATALALAALTGARRAELCGLTWSDIDTESAKLTIRQSVVRGRSNGELVVKETKTGRVRRITLDVVSLAILKQHRMACDESAAVCGSPLTSQSFVFSPEPDGSSPFNPETITSFVCRLRGKVGLPELRLHHLRHFAATQLVATGVDIRTVAGRLGHSSPSITLNIYSHFIEDADKEAARRMGALMQGAMPPPQPRQAKRSG